MKYQLRKYVSIYIPIHGHTVGFDRTTYANFFLLNKTKKIRVKAGECICSRIGSIHDACFTILSITNILVTVRIFTSWCQHILSSRIRRTRTITHFFFSRSHFFAVGSFNKNHFEQHFPFQFYERIFSKFQIECDIFHCDLIVNSIFCVFLVLSFDNDVHASDEIVFVWIELSL